MNKIFIEAKHEKTAEYYFLKAILDKFFPEKEVQFFFMDGIGNLFKESILNQISQSQIINDSVLVLADADTEVKGWGYEKRRKSIETEMRNTGMVFPFFLYPNNHDNGDVEELMEATSLHDTHKVFFDCFEDYEKCIKGVKDKEGSSVYNSPNLKGKLHTYISAQKLNKKCRDRLGAGDWLFDRPEYWNLDVVALQALKDFFAEYLK